MTRLSFLQNGVMVAMTALFAANIAKPAQAGTAANEGTVRQAFAAWANGTGGPYDLLADEVSWTITGNSLASKTYPSREAFLSEVIRPFNARDTYPDQDLDNDLCQAVVAGDTVYLRGQIGQDLDTSESIGIGDVEAQAERAMANIDMLLREAGSRLEDIVKVVVYLVDPRYREPVYRVMGRWLKGVHPVSTGIVVTALARPEWLVEIDAMAVIPAGGAETETAPR